MVQLARRTVPYGSVTSVTSVTKVKDALQNSSEIGESSEVMKESVTGVTHVTDHTHTPGAETVPSEVEVKPLEVVDYSDLLTQWGISANTDISEHIKMRARICRCMVQGCTYSGDLFWMKSGAIPIPLCDHHYQELKKVKK